MRANGQEEETAPEKVLAVAARFHQRSHLSFLVLVPMRGVTSGVFSLHSRSIAILDFLLLRFGRLDAGKPGKEALAGRKAFECAKRGVFVEGFSQDGLPPLLPPPPATLSFESTLVPSLISLLSPPPRPVEERGGTSKSRETSIETQRRDRKTRKEDETETHFSFSSSKLKLKKSNNKKNFHL